MNIRTPKFWYTDHHILSYLLYPIGLIYKSIVEYRINNAKPNKLKIPVICVGNINAGGSGKTPNVIKLAFELQKKGFNPHILLRGYGRNGDQDLLVDNKQHNINDVGDEALIISNYAPTWVTKDRYQAGLKAIEHGADIIILDDGLQNPNIYKDINIVIIDGNTGLGNNAFIPAGPLRESLNNVLKRADAFIIMGKDRFNIKDKIKGRIVIQGQIIADENIKNKIKDKPIHAFAGIGLPEKFKDTLLNIGSDIKEFNSFPDHYKYSDNEIANMIKNAKKDNCLLITTEKDMVKITEKYRQDIIALPIKLSWDSNKIMDII